jgi:hypothetical protein
VSFDPSGVDKATGASGKEKFNKDRKQQSEVPATFIVEVRATAHLQSLLPNRKA